MATTVSARMDDTLKTQAEEVMSRLGITHSTAIQALYAQIVLQQGLPFAIRIPHPILTQNEIRACVRKHASSYGAERVYLFGSYARGDATSSSDIDLRVDKGKIRGIDLGGFLYDISNDLGVKVDVATTESLSDAFLASIADEELLLYEA